MKSIGLPLVFVALTSFVGAALAQAKLDAPPPLPPETKATDKTAPNTAQASPAQPATRIDSPDAGVENPLPPAKTTSPETKIEQHRQGNRVVEIVVTPAGTNYSYVIKNREGMRPLSPQNELSGGLSTPRFLQFDF